MPGTSSRTVKDPEDDGHPCIELHLHETVRDGIADVLEMHGGALDENADGNDGVQRLAGNVCGGGGEAATKEIGRGCVRLGL